VCVRRKSLQFHSQKRSVRHKCVCVFSLQRGSGIPIFYITHDIVYLKNEVKVKEGFLRSSRTSHQLTGKCCSVPSKRHCTHPSVMASSYKAVNFSLDNISDYRSAILKKTFNFCIAACSRIKNSQTSYRL